MKLNSRDAKNFTARPDASSAGILLYGASPMRVADARTKIVNLLAGPNGAEELRLTRLPAADLRKDGAALQDALKAASFFPGQRVVTVEDATDGLAKLFTDGLSAWQDGDAFLVVTAGQLPARSGLRKTFENAKNAYAAGIYDDPPSRQELEQDLAKAGISRFGRDFLAALESLSRDIGPGDLRQVIEKLALYKLGDETEARVEDLDAVAPDSTEAALDDAINLTAEGRSDQLGPLMSRLSGQGVQPVTICIGATRHFRTLYAVASNPGGPEQGIGKMRPPIFGPRRDRILRQARGWGVRKLETALEILVDTDLTLRSSARVPHMAVMERSLIRLAMLGRPK